MNHTFYWRLRKHLLSIAFFFKKQQYHYGKRKDKQLFIKPLKNSIAKTILSRVVLSAMIVFIMVGLDQHFLCKAKIDPFDVSLYKDLLLGGMGIAGVILGLYCANIASVFSAKYSNVPNQIAHDFQNDIITQSAIKEIIGYIVVCTLTLMLCIAEVSLTWVSLSILALLTIRMVVVFSISGTRTYNLSDTFRIADIHWNDREKKPDFLGMCYNHLCEHLIRAIESNDYIKFEALYRDFFSLTLLYQEYVRANVVQKKEQHLQAAVVYAATDPYVEYGIISGLATLWGEFTADKRWRELVRSTLDEFLQTDLEEKKKILTQITQVVQGRRAFMVGITNRSVMQTDWEMRVERAIVGNKAFQFEYREFGQKYLKTESKLLYAFAGSMFNDILDFNNTEDVFFIVFVNRYLDESEKYKSQLGWEEDEDCENF